MPDYLDKLIGELIGLARATDGNEHLISESSTAFIIEGLYVSTGDSACDENTIQILLERIVDEKKKMVPDCFLCASPCGKTAAYNMDRLRNGKDELYSLKLMLLSAAQTIASKFYTSAAPGNRIKSAALFLYKLLVAIGLDTDDSSFLSAILAEAEIYISVLDHTKVPK